MMEIIFYVITVSLILYSIYFFIKCIIKNKFIKNYNPKTKFGIIIPARNEEKVIGKLIDSLISQNYPKNMYDIFVIPNNCNDNTEQIAISKNVNILKYDIKFNSKGEVLKKAFSDLIKENYDAFIIFDADNIVDKNFIKEMNNSVLNGSLACQGYRDSKNYNDNWLSYSYSMFYWLQNLFFNKIGNTSVSGTGFMIKKDIIKQYGFNMQTLTEDIEFSVNCNLNKIKIDFCSTAITYDEQPTNIITSWVQRKRWTVGVVQCLKLYIKKIIKKHDMTSFILLNNPIWNLLILLIYLLFISNIKYLVLLTIIAYLFSLYISIMILIFNKKKFNIKFLSFSLFLLIGIPINIIYLFVKDYNWEQIEHKC